MGAGPFPVVVRATPSKIPKWASCGLYKNSGSGDVVVRATPSKIPKWASCGLYKNSGSGEMRLMG